MSPLYLLFVCIMRHEGENSREYHMYSRRINCVAVNPFSVKIKQRMNLIRISFQTPLTAIKKQNWRLNHQKLRMIDLQKYEAIHRQISYISYQVIIWIILKSQHIA